ncbi:Gfo/Idh/MocA family protein [Paludisphaera mucosa]|uniref:Gfo/Idh/MocA family oxidoreductase n=1 Tax=Paludisphaera mucosa TaxID=3030827 RepID=A0ABT6F4L6_9BACT|nr:Gfo/Idh/MocA family oxidoreductase [Paludisphaera mucosa]MDG3002383.1 Gfo/Idh/MocA family oxidoreductase [Paludisphaera mucosa]
MARLGFGIVGTGLIAGVVADAIARSREARLAAVSSRRLANATGFVAGRPGAVAVEGVEALLGRDDVEAVYVAAPTTAKEPIALAAIAAGKHVLVDKPFADVASVARMSKAAANAGLAFLDATHFVHHPRTAAVKASKELGTPRSLHTAFYIPSPDRGNIRLDVNQEPTGALGDLGWYSMRAVVEYLAPAGRVAKAAAVLERDPENGAVVRASGLIAFEGGEASTFDVGYTAGTVAMDLSLFGTAGVIGMDDFVLDWADSFAYKNPDLPVGYTFRTGPATRKDVTFIPTPTAFAQEVLMVDHFAEIAASGDLARRAAYAEAAIQTQRYLDALWQAARS